MKKMKVLAAVAALLFVVVGSAFTNKKPPTLKMYGWEDGVSQIVPDQQEQITGGSFVDFTQFQDLVLLENVTDQCTIQTGKKCKIQLSSIEETDNVRFTLDPDGIHITVRVREPLVSSSNYVVNTVDNKILSYF